MTDISVIVPVYNIEECIGNCIDSVLNQTFPDFELILVDDGSTDRSGEICDSYAEKDSRIKVVHQKNKGVSNARNTGVSYSNGKYIAFVDGDDLIAEEYLMVLYSLCIENNAEMSICGIQRIKNNQEKQSVATKSDLIVSTGREALIRNAYKLDTQFRGPVIKLIKREIVASHPFPEDRSYTEDMACVYLWMHDCSQVAEVSSKLYYYNYREGSLTKSKINEKRLGLIKTYNEMLDFFYSNDYPQLYDFFVCESLLEYVMSYEICISEGKDKLAELFQNEVIFTCKERLHFVSDQIVKHYEDLITVFESSEKHEFVNIYVPMCVMSMSLHVNDIKYNDYPDIASRLKKLLAKYKLSIKEYPLAYNVAYPKTMQYYWTIQGIKHKLKRIFKTDA